MVTAMNNPKSAIQNPKLALRRSFTLMELLIVLLIITILAALAMSAMAGATELAREQRTRAILTKLDQLIMDQYEGYRTRAVPVRMMAGTNPRVAAQNRLNGLRELMRLEMPDRISDLCTAAELTDLQSGDNTLNAIVNRNDANPRTLTSIPSLARSYKRKAAMLTAATGGWTSSQQGAECLYLIVSMMHDGDKSAIDFFSASEIGDTDGDGMKEILDGWGTPIEFLRWAPGFTIENGALTMQTSAYATSPDPFDPAKADPRWTVGGPGAACYALRPLIFSAGRDKLYDINVGAVVYSMTASAGPPPVPPNDPYYAATPMVGQPYDTNGDGALSWGDNITNHYLQTP
jgi:prepilin-type N-terminal cleavage/methylation domain-containing protein